MPALLAGAAAILFCGLLFTKSGNHAAPGAARPRVETFAGLPLSFEAAPAGTSFVARGRGYSMRLSADRIRLGFASSSQAPALDLDLKLLGASSEAAIESTAPLPGRSNYFIGNDPRAWRTDVPTYARVQYRDVYPGVNLAYYGNQQQLEYDFIVAPHADPSRIRWTVEGAATVALTPEGDLLLAAGESREVRLLKPRVYQLKEAQDAGRREIAGNYRLVESGSGAPAVSFEIGAYDASLPLIIDPVVNYATFYGGSGTDIGYGIAVDQQGAIYLTGQTSSSNFPTKSPLDASLEGANDAFVMKLNSQGTTVVFSTYIGGRNPGDRGWAIAVDRAGNIYFTGETNSLNFPTVNAAQPVFRGGIDGFVAKLNIEGNVLLYSTYLGGGFTDVSYAIAIDRFDNAYVTGRTESANFPLKSPLQDKLKGQRDVFVTRYTADGEIFYSTYLGGEPAAAGAREEETGYGIAVDALQNACITGYTTSAGFPVKNALQSVFGGVEDAFVAKLSASGASLLFSTFLGGDRADNGRGIALDPFGNLYVIGYTLSQNFPTANALQAVFGGSGDGFVTKINASGEALLYSTFLGGNGDENSGLITDITPSCAIAVDSLGNAYVTGKTESKNFPLARAIQNELKGDNDAYVAKLDPAGSELIFSSFLGSTFTGNTGFEERGMSIAVDRLGSIYLTGQMLKSDYPTVQPVQANYGGGLSDAFITKISTPDIVGIAAISAASFIGGSLAPESIVAGFGAGLASGTEVATTVPLPTTLGGTTVRVRDKLGFERLAPLFFVSANQVNFLIPANTAPGKAIITITATQGGQTTTSNTTVLIEPAAPGLFAASASGQGTAAAIIVRVKADGAQSFEPVVRLDEFGRLVAVPIDLGPETDQVFLVLFGTGWRQNGDLARAKATIGELDAPVADAGAQGSFVGQDQLNARIPRSLAGKGEVPVYIAIEGKIANQVTIQIR
ncbi:MAG: SBBP repeat-containing protein [Blastocatellia bacterium]|nr:SBBP repeat-containing protein [Blastocatellia bacterium]